MKRLGALLYYKISSALKITGSYNPDITMPLFEESLTHRDYDMIHAFLSWVYEKHKTFGSANYEQVFKEWQEDLEFEQDEREVESKERNFTQGTE